jgi:hypothetical protein
VIQYSEEKGAGGKLLPTYRELINPFPEQAPLPQLRRLRTLTTVTLPGPALGSFTGIDLQVWQLLSVDPVLQGLLRMFKGISCAVKLFFLQRSSPTSYGVYSVSYRYGSPYEEGIVAGATGRWLGVYERFTGPTFLVDIGNAASLEITFPYRFNFPYINPTNVGSTSTDYLYVSIQNLMCINDGASDNLVVDVMYSIDEIDTGLYTSSNLLDVQSGKGLVPSALETAAFVGSQMLFNKISDIIDSYTERVPGNTTNTAMHSSGPASSQTPVGPSAGGQTNNMRISRWGNLSGTKCGNTDGDLEATVNTTVPELFGMPDQYSLGQICKLPGLITVFRFSSADAVNTKITIPVCLRNVGKNIAINEATWAGYYSMFFRFYRGDHKYVFHWNTSTLVAARVQLSVQYLREFTTNSLTLSPVPFPSEEMPNQIYQVRGSSEKEVVVPWHAFSHIKRPRDVVAMITVTLTQPPKRSGTSETYINCAVTHSLHNAHMYSMCPAQYLDPVVTDREVATNALKVATEKFRTQEPDRKTQVERRKGEKFEKEFGFLSVQSDLRLMHAGDKGEFALTGRQVDFAAHLNEVADLYTLFRRWDNDVNQADGVTPNFRTDCTLRTSGTTPIGWTNLSLLEQASEPFLFNTGSIEVKHALKGTVTGTQFVYIKSIDQPTSTRVGLGAYVIDASVQPIYEFVLPYLCTAPAYFRKPGASIMSPITAEVGYTYGIPDVDTALVRGGCNFRVFYPNCLPALGAWMQTGAAH